MFGVASAGWGAAAWGAVEVAAAAGGGGSAAAMAAVALLQHPLDDQARRADDQLAMLLQEVGRDDRLRHAGLVLQGEEEQPLRGAGALADDDRAGGADEIAMAVADE